MRKTVRERFDAKVIRSEIGCWVWTGARSPKGYGRMSRGKRGTGMVLAHRVSYELHTGPIPAGACVLHRCDNPPCVNPSHLFIGSLADNSADMAAKGRHVGSRKLTEAQVAEIRRLWPTVNQRAIAAEFGITPSNVSMIVHRKRWATA